MPPSLDTILAFTLSWLYILHPSDSVSRRTDPAFNGARTGLGSGAPTVVEGRVVRELGEVIGLARAMGLGYVSPGSAEKRAGSRNLGRGRRDVEEDDVEGDGTMGIWEREMRRRVWWELKWWDM